MFYMFSRVLDYQLFRIILFTVCTLIFGGCSKNDSYVFVQKDYKELYDFIVYTNSIEALLYGGFTDFNYALPDKDWIKKVYLPALSQFLFDNNIRRYSSEVNDCDKYSLYGLTVAHLNYYKSKNKLPGTSLAVGEFVHFFNLSSHSILFFVVYNENKDMELLFVEPQTQQFIDLDYKHFGCSFWRL